MNDWFTFSNFEAGAFEAIVRIYDQFGFAAEEKITVDLHNRPGTIIERRLRQREELY
jgi:hypothetical protein